MSSIVNKGTCCPVCGGRLVPWADGPAPGYEYDWHTMPSWRPWVDCCTRPLDRAVLRWIDICEDCETVVT